MKSNWKVALIALGGVVAVALMCVFGVYSSQNKAIAMEEGRLGILRMSLQLLRQ